jgi:hypothetical protein
MNFYRVIELADGAEWACNRNYEGLFSRRSDGTWQQHLGTGQTPRFRTPRALSRYLHAHYRNRDGEPLPRMRTHRGWRTF